MPTSSPSSRVSRRDVSIASSSLMAMISSRMSWLRMPGAKPAPMPCMAVRPGRPPWRTGERGGSTAMILTAGVGGFVLLEHLADAGDSAAGAHAGNEGIDLAAGGLKDLPGGGAAVDVGIRR